MSASTSSPQLGRSSTFSISPHARYEQTCALSGVEQPHRDGIWEELRQRHSSAPRVHHTLQHLMDVFDVLRRATKSGYTMQHPAAVEWAVWFHDAVYNPGSSTNEAESAELAAQLLLPAGLPAETVARVQKYIRATADHHHMAGDPDGDLFMDADMAVLGAPLPRYIEYAVAVRQECSHMSDAEFTAARSRKLKSLLDREQLFLTDLGKSLFESEARANMSYEWRLTFGGQVLSGGTIDEADREGTDEDMPPSPPSAAEPAAADGQQQLQQQAQVGGRSS